ncbi:MAG: leucine-rich repeat protein [Clostridia bacterium]|nr:leucine-rich repeat protein [Clostridia bacterium]
MSFFKCKMCGGDLEISEGTTVAECEYCGTKQTVPSAIDENLQNLFNRANTLRIKSEFDKAEKLYEKIIQADTTQSEAYWGLILCKYGIEYVDDPVTFRKIPTCHRASYESIIADDDYKSAIENADMSQRALYEEQAKEIDRIQREILALAQKEESYDVFICYKETDSNGKRTQDSVIANDIYYQLTAEGFKVFYAAITLEGKLGSAYEPIIFAALNSAKVMLTIGTKPEYFNAVWVKNEWSRYLKIIKKDRSKLLIPCYRDMDAYELPDEFAHLQAQDMSKIGFINDIVRGIKKVIQKGEPIKTAVFRETVTTNANINASPLLKRAYLFLEDLNWQSADEYCEKVLDIEPENAEAYLCKLLIELSLRKRENLANCNKSFENSGNYQKAMRFGSDGLKAELNGYLDTVKARAEEARKQEIYDSASEQLDSDSIYKFVQAQKQFESILGYKDSDEKIAFCQRRIDEIKAHEEAERQEREAREEAERIQREKEKALAEEEARMAKKRLKRLAAIFIPIACVAVIFVIVLTKVIIPNGKYNDAVALIETGDDVGAFSILLELGDYKDCDELVLAIYERAEESAHSKYLEGECTEAIKICESFGLDEKADLYKCVQDGKYWEAIEKGLTDIVIPNGVTSIDDYVFYQCTGLTSITIPDSVTSIGNYAFSNCTGLTSVTIPNSVTSIGDRVFSNCIGLTSVTIPDSVTSIGPFAFYRCTKLTTIAIPDSVTNIDANAFRGCTGLTSVIISDSVTSIGLNAFEGCSNLTAVYCTFGEYLSFAATDLGLSAEVYYYSEEEPREDTYNYWHYVDGVPTPW